MLRKPQGTRRWTTSTARIDKMCEEVVVRTLTANERGVHGGTGEHIVSTSSTAHLRQWGVSKGGGVRKHVNDHKVEHRYDPFGVRCAVLETYPVDVLHIPQSPPPLQNDDAHLIVDEAGGEVWPSKRSRRRRRTRVSLRKGTIRRKKRKQVCAVLEPRSERDLFCNALDKLDESVNSLCGSASSSSEIQATHTLLESRDIGFLSFVSEDAHDGRKKGYLSVLWQTMRRPKRAVTITVSASKDASDFTVVCSCDVLVKCSNELDSTCEHVEACMSSRKFMETSAHIVQKRIECAEHTGSKDLVQSGVENDSGFIVAELVRQLPMEDNGQNVDKDAIALRTAKMLMQWSFYLSFDPMDELFVPVLKERKRAFRCLVCRGLASRRGFCGHELACIEDRRMQQKEDAEKKKDSNVEGGSKIEAMENFQDRKEHPDGAETESDDSSIDESSEDEDVVKEQAKRRCRSDVARKIAEKKMAYYSNMKSRSLLLCKGEAQDTMQLVDMMECTTAGEHLYLRDTGQVKCRQCGIHREKSCSSEWRAMRIVTVSHGAPIVCVEDWCCGKGHWNYYTGESHGLFPCRRHLAFTVELMYVWVNAVCYEALPMRKAFSMSCLSGAAVSTLHSLRKKGMQARNWQNYRRGRRIANEALRHFIKRIDVHSEPITNLLFTCDTCEVPLTEEDKEELNLTGKDCTGLKRLKAAVIDGTSQGILGELPKYNNHQVTLKVAESLRRRQTLASSAPWAKFFKRLMNVVRDYSRLYVRRYYNQAVRPSALQICITGAAEKGLPEKTDLPLKKGDIQKLRLLLEDNPCFCNGDSGVHDDECVKTTKSMKELDSVRLVFRELFQLRREEQDFNEECINEPFRSDTSEQERRWYLDLLIPYTSRDMQFHEAVVELLLFLLSEKAIQPYIASDRETIRRRRQGGKDCGPYLKKNVSNGDLGHGGGAKLCQSSITRHEEFSTALKNFSACTHQDGSKAKMPCNACCKELRIASNDMNEVNPVLSRMGQETLRKVKMIPHVCRSLAERVVDLLRDHMYVGTAYAERLMWSISPDCKEYMDLYSSGKLKPINGGKKHEEESGAVFPGRKRYRPAISFNNAELDECNKHYPLSKNHSPGLMTVQCACSSPKIIGFVIMTRAESVSVAISSVLTHLQILPRVLVYDNACNMFASVLLRVPWILKGTRLVVDRFHYNGHTCSSMFNMDKFRTHDALRSMTAESFNSRLKEALPHMRYLRGDHFMDYLRVRCAFLNLASYVKQKYRRSDMEETDIPSVFRDIYECTCVACSFHAQGTHGNETSHEPCTTDGINRDAEKRLEGLSDATEGERGFVRFPLSSGGANSGSNATGSVTHQCEQGANSSGGNQTGLSSELENLCTAKESMTEGHAVAGDVPPETTRYSTSIEAAEHQNDREDTGIEGERSETENAKISSGTQWTGIARCGTRRLRFAPDVVFNEKPPSTSKRDESSPTSTQRLPRSSENTSEHEEGISTSETETGGDLRTRKERESLGILGTVKLKPPRRKDRVRKDSVRDLFRVIVKYMNEQSRSVLDYATAIEVTKKHKYTQANLNDMLNVYCKKKHISYDTFEERLSLREF